MGPVPFEQGESVSVSVGNAASVRTILGKPLKNRTVHLANLTAARIIFVRFGDATVVATPDDTAVLPYESMVFTVPDAHTHVAAIADTALTAAEDTLNITSGFGGMD